MRWQKMLTKHELRHLKEQGINTLYALRQSRETQRTLKEQVNYEPCIDCKIIAGKLGME